MAKRGIAPVVAFAAGGLALLVGTWLVGAYVFGAIIDRLGQPDQSLLFWYLPLLFMGIGCLAVGGGAIALGVAWRRKAAAQQGALRLGGSEGEDV